MAETLNMRRIAEEVWIQDGYLHLKNYPLERDVLYILCPYGIGDTLYAASLVRSYKEYYGIQKVFFILKEAQSIIADWYEEIDGKIASNEIVEMLNLYAIAAQTWELKNFLYGHFKKTREITLLPEYYEVKEKNMISRYKRLVFRIPLECVPEPIKWGNKEAFRAVKKNGIDKKTIILMPYAVSCPLLPDIFWETLAHILKISGYKVFTNTKDLSELPIAGTERITGNLEELSRICEECLLVISIRSGMCDMLAFTDTLLVVIDTREDYYREWNLGDVTAREGIMSLLCDDPSKMTDVMKEILSVLDIS